MSWKLVSLMLLPGAVSADGSVLAFVGSTGSTILSFILPGAFYFNLFRQEKGMLKWGAFALAAYGLAVMSFWLVWERGI